MARKSRITSATCRSRNKSLPLNAAPTKTDGRVLPLARALRPSRVSAGERRDLDKASTEVTAIEASEDTRPEGGGRFTGRMFENGLPARGGGKGSGGYSEALRERAWFTRPKAEGVQIDGVGLSFFRRLTRPKAVLMPLKMPKKAAVRATARHGLPAKGGDHIAGAESILCRADTEDRRRDRDRIAGFTCQTAKAA